MNQTIQGMKQSKIGKSLMYGSAKSAQGLCYYVMNRMDDAWIKVSEVYTDRKEATKAYDRLRKIYPFARLGGSKVE